MRDRRHFAALIVASALASCSGPIDAAPDAAASDASTRDASRGHDASAADASRYDGGEDASHRDEDAASPRPDAAPGEDASSPPFVPGETMPYYEVTIDFSGERNVGNLPGVALVPYPGRCDGGVMRLEAGTYENYDFGNCLLDVRGDVVMNNCRGVLADNYDTTLGEHIRIFNGASTTRVVLNDCEFHNRSQRMIDGLKGRNFVVNRSVFTGYVDGVNNGSPGSAPALSGGEINDSWIGDLAWWRAPTTGVVHGSDTQTHNDGSQVTTGLGIRYVNTFFGAWASEHVGTGTPGSGSETNPNTAAYIVDQATMEAWRATYLDRYTRADQSWGGTPHRLSTGGSWAAIMANASGGTVDHCWFSGGTVSINLLDASVGTGTWSIRRSTFWNDMSGGRPLDSTTKGVAIFVRGDRTYDIPTTGPDANRWFDGTIVTPNVM